MTRAEYYWRLRQESKMPNQKLIIERVTNNVMSLLMEKVGGMNHANNGDSFYTQRHNINNEMANYDFNGMVVYCNCDNPSMSEFYKFFKENYSNLGLRGLYATYYDENPMMFYFNGNSEVSKVIKSGRFQDNAQIMKKCDVVVTNPPFSDSMASELITMARKMGKHVIIVGPNTIANQKEMFNLIKNGDLNMGYTSINRFNRPDGTTKTAPTSWWTTMQTNKPTFNTKFNFDSSKYPTYDNYPNIIHVEDYRNIPNDYYGYMAVSPKFLRVLNRDQFEIIDKIRPILNGENKMERYVIKRK